jgi:hypothetical protein
MEDAAGAARRALDAAGAARRALDAGLVGIVLEGEFAHGVPAHVKTLELYPVDDAWGIDLDRIAVCATIKLEK